MGCHRLEVFDAAAGVVQVPMTDYVRNSISTINGGVMITAAEAAAELAAQEALGAGGRHEPHTTASWTKPGSAGPNANDGDAQWRRLVDSQRDRYLAGYAVIQFAAL